MDDTLVLKYSHNVVEHLGLKLYQNRPTSVIAEIVSNAWDADAANVLVHLSMQADNRWVSVIDNGHGMSRTTLAENYLVIGQPRRASSSDRTTGNRPLMGRKGIGKLAPFGIAGCVDVLTSAEDAGEREIHWLRIELAKLLANELEGSYKPIEVFRGSSLADLPFDEDATDSARAWREHVEKTSNGLGTLVLMSQLSISRAIPTDRLIESLGRRFTVTLNDKFAVYVNNELVTKSNALPRLEFRIPEEGEITEQVAGHEVRYWVGFVESAQWPADSAGVGVYAHGKIAQDRPFTFGVKGKEIFQRYMYGVVEADWLDEMDEDLISTDRTSLNWDTQYTKPLYQWGQGKLKKWVGEFEVWRQELEKKEVRERIKKQSTSGAAPTVTENEEEQIVELVSQITPSFGKDEEGKNRLVKAVADAWVQKPMRKLVRDLWSTVGAHNEMPPQQFTLVVEKLSAHSVPESLNLSVIFAQRAFALTRLNDYVHHGREVDLQRLIERFPWIIEPDLAVLTANQTLKTAIENAEKLGQIPTGRRTNVGGVPDRNKPDFVFLSSPEGKRILAVELKNPQENLEIENRLQLTDYMAFFEKHYPNSETRGYLVGSNPGNTVEAKHPDLTIIPWTEVLERSRARNLELLAAMLLQTGGTTPDDARLADAIELGGDEIQEMLRRLADHHSELKELIDRFERIET